MSKERFHEQIEAVLDANIKKLADLDQERSQAVNRLQQAILDELRQGNELDDGNLSPEEYGEICRNLLQNDVLRPIFEKYIIQGHYDIDMFIGFPLREGMEFIDLQLFGRDVKLVYGFHIDSTMYPELRAALKAEMAFLETKPEFKPLITPETRFTVVDDYRMLFEVEKNGEKKTYIVSPTCVLLVKEDRGLSEEISQDMDTFVLQTHKVMVKDFFKSIEQLVRDFKGVRIVNLNSMNEGQKRDVVSFAERFHRRVMIDEETGHTVFEVTSKHGETILVFVDKKRMLRRLARNNMDLSFDEEGRKRRYVFYEEKYTKKTIADFDGNGELARGEISVGSGSPYAKFSRGMRSVYDDSGKLQYRHGVDGKNERLNALYFSDGSSLCSFLYERVKSKKERGRYMTEEEYMNVLARKLDTPKKLGLFFKLFMKYKYDNPENEARHGSGGVAVAITDRLREHWQTWEETLRRIDDQGIMMGDCEDYSFLAREILRRQGKNAHVISYYDENFGGGDGGSHAICMWIERDVNGNYMAHSFSTEGLRTAKKDTEPDGKKDISSSGAYTTASEAVEDLLRIHHVLRPDKLIMVLDLDKNGKTFLKDFYLANIEKLFPEK